jgi:hypothetical protein
MQQSNSNKTIRPVTILVRFQLAVAVGWRTNSGWVPITRVELSPITLTTTRHGLSGLLIWPRAEMRTPTESRWVQSSPMSLAESRVLMLHVSLPSVGLQSASAAGATLRWKTNVEKLISFYLRASGQSKIPLTANRPAAINGRIAQCSFQKL